MTTTTTILLILMPINLVGGLELPLKEKTTSDDRPRPGPPRNVSVAELSNGFLITWMPPQEKSHLVKFYTIQFKTDGPWKTLNKGQIRPEDTSYLMKNLVGGRTYYFTVIANSTDSAGISDQIKYPVPARVKHKAITAGVVGGILFFIVAIILSICAVKICNKRKRRKQEKELLSAYNMVACRVTDARNGAGQGPHGTVPLKKSSNLNVCGGESVATLTRCSPLNPQPPLPPQPPQPPQPLHQPPLPPQQVISQNPTTTATSTTEPCSISHGDQPTPPVVPPPNRDHHSLQIGNRDYESVFIIERRNSKPNIR